jgi:hypothetical protein
MHFSTAILALAAGASIVVAQANPALCGGRVAQCCETDVLDLAAITCENREFYACFPYVDYTDNQSATGAPQTIDEFNAVCADLGVTAQCCVLPIVSLMPMSDSRPMY